MAITGFDHVALPAGDPEALIRFYGALGFSVPDYDEWRRAGLPFFAVHLGRPDGGQKINFHAPELWQSEDFALRGPTASPGCGDLCFVWDGDVESISRRLAEVGADRVAGPVELRGGRGRGTSVYTRDPDGNLLEFIVYGG